MLLVVGVVAVTVASRLAAAASTKFVQIPIRDFERRGRSGRDLIPTPSTYGSGSGEREKRTISDFSAANIPIVGGLLSGDRYVCVS